MAVNKAQIVEELERVSTSSEFRNKPVMKRLLAYLVNEYIEGRSDQIKGYSIAVDVFGQGKDFDSDRSAVVRNSAARLRGLLDAYYLGAGNVDPVRIDIPKGAYSPRFSTTSGGATAAPGIGGEGRATSVAVLPFNIQFGGGEYDFIATGFSQELTDALTRFDDIRVIGVGHLMGHAIESSELAEEFRNKRIDYLISGTIKIFQDQGVLRVRLINATNGHQIWEESFRIDLSLENLLQIQEELTGKIASHVGGEFGQINQSRLQTLLQSQPRSMSEHEVLLKHYHTTTVLTEEAILDYEETLVLELQNDPDSPLLNALASAGYQAIWYALLPGFEEARDRLSYHAEKAYSLNPNHQVISSVLSGKCFIFDERERFFSLYERHGRSLANSPLRLGAWAMYTAYFGEWARGMQMMNAVIDNNIDVPAWIHCMPAMNQYRQGNYEDALIQANKCHMHGLFWGPAIRSSILGQLGRHEQARREYQAVLECRPDFPENGRILLGRFFKEPGLLNHFIEGFDKSGISLA